jgi:hypothetical protein
MRGSPAAACGNRLGANMTSLKRMRKASELQRGVIVPVVQRSAAGQEIDAFDTVGIPDSCAPLQ